MTANFRQPDEVACFALKIQFAQETPAQVCLQMAKFIALTYFGVRVDEVATSSRASRSFTI